MYKGNPLAIGAPGRFVISKVEVDGATDARIFRWVGWIARPQNNRKAAELHASFC